MTELLSALPERLKENLEAIILGKRLPHSIILEGEDTEISDKVTDIITQTAVCSSDGRQPCGECNACMKVFKKIHPDVYYLKGSTATGNVSIDDIRKMLRDTYTIPNEAPAKVYVLTDCHRFSSQVQNALLKSLEEPNQSIVYILRCASSDTLLETVKSRCITLKLDAYSEIDTDAVDKAQDIAITLAGICAQRDMEFDLLCECEKLSDEKGNFELIFTELKKILLMSASNTTGNVALGETVAQLRRLGSNKILRMIDVAEKARSFSRYNMNTALFLTWFCAALKEAKSSEML